ncbi:phage scaffold protein [Latilactobacillus sakei]|uniref:phage scaffold protein n=1 Tax=Latilactobacillus sakei TaxID=1599 RepID=UPI000978A7C1|nr:phage scaffold protein [Latilactobacillus sakei]
MTFKTIETQEELDKIIKDRIDRVNEKYADYDQLKSRNEELTAENSALQTTVSETSEKVKGFDQEKADMMAKISGFETSKLRTQVALKHGLPIDLADRLQGEDEAALTKDAERLSGFMKPDNPTPPLANPEGPQGSDKNESYRKLIENMNMEE